MIIDTLMLVLASATQSPALSQEELLIAHRNAVESVSQVSMRLEVYRTGWKETPLSRPLHLCTFRWDRDLENERQRYRFHHGLTANADGRPNNLGDLLDSKKQRRVLRNWDPDDPQNITPHLQGTVNAWFGPIETVTTSVFPNPVASFALFQIQGNLEDSCLTLQQLVADSPSVEIEEKTESNGNRVWQMRIAHPDDKTGGGFAGSRYEVILDPGVNYLVKSVVCHVSDSDPSPANTVPIRTERHVVNFNKTKEGVYYPTKVIAQLYDAKAPRGSLPASEQLWEAHDVIVNETLPKDAFSFKFPEHAQVYEKPPVNGSYPLHIWGPDDKPAITYTGDYKEFRLSAPVQSEVGENTSRELLIIINVLVLLLIGVALYVRRRLKSAY